MSKETAESKLLKLIEEADAKDKPAADPAAAPDAAKVLNSVSSVGVGAIQVPPFLQKILALFYKGGQPRQGFGLQTVNQLLLVVIFALGMFFAYDFSKGLESSRQPVAINVPGMDSEVEVRGLPDIADVMNYLAAASQRNIFKPFEKKAEEVKVAAPIENQRIKDKLTNYKLVGISWLATPETATAMIEDTNTAVTHFLRAGEDLQGVRIEIIYADRVEFSFQGEKLTINL